MSQRNESHHPIRDLVWRVDQRTPSASIEDLIARYDTVEAIASATLEGLSSIRGISSTRAKNLIAAARSNGTEVLGRLVRYVDGQGVERKARVVRLRGGDRVDLQIPHHPATLHRFDVPAGRGPNSWEPIQ